MSTNIASPQSHNPCTEELRARLQDGVFEFPIIRGAHLQGLGFVKGPFGHIMTCEDYNSWGAL